MAATSLDSLQRAKIAFKALSDKKAEDIVVLHLGEYSSIAEYFVIATGNSEPQLRAIARNVHADLREADSATPARMFYEPESGWALVDGFDVVVHAFTEEMREFYKLEELWKDAERINTSSWDA